MRSGFRIPVAGLAEVAKRVSRTGVPSGSLEARETVSFRLIGCEIQVWPNDRQLCRAEFGNS